MGAMLKKSGTAEKLFEAIHLWTHRLPGGLAVGTILMCVIFAACSGVIGATETVVGLLATPVMLRHGYDKALISGTITAGGSLGAIIPPLGCCNNFGSGIRNVAWLYVYRNVYSWAFYSRTLNTLHYNYMYTQSRG